MVVIVAGETSRAVAVFPDPGAEAILELLLFLPRGDGFLLIDGARSVRVLVIGGRRAAVQGLLDEVGGAETLRPVRCGVGDAPFLGSVDLDGPGGDGCGVRNTHGARRFQ